jgi:hypothetical protein
MKDEETIIAYQRWLEWTKRWDAIRFYLIAIKHLMIWVAGVGSGLIVIYEGLSRLFGGGPSN